MVQPVDQMISSFAAAGATYISFHPEASLHVDRSIQLIIDAGCKPGLVLNPATPLCVLENVIHKLSHVLLMSVNPGFGGQSFIPQTLNKIKRVKQLIQQSGREIRIEIDGGVKVDNIRAIAEAGADMFVAGSAIFGQADYQHVIKQMRDELAQAHT
jgi:ribulose-phosphate 3-epimerase